MVRLQLALALVAFCLFVFCLVDAIRTPQDEVRHLPKTVWLLIVLFFPFVGSIAWLIAGRPKKAPRSRGASRGSSGFPEYDRPGRAAASNPDDDEEFLRQLRARAEEQRRRSEEQRKRDEQDEPPPPTDPDPQR